MSEKKKKIIIIGAGPAGLTAAMEIVNADAIDRHNISLTVLESSDSVGGLAKTVAWKDHLLDIGGHRFFTREPEIAKWWEKRSRNNGDFLETRKRKVRILFDDQLYDYPVRLNRETVRKLGIWRAVRIGVGYLAVKCVPKKENSLENFYINRFGKPLYGLFFKEYTEKLCGESLKCISPEWGKQRVRGLSLREILKDTKSERETDNHSDQINPDLFRYPKKGPGAMWEATAGEISENGGEIRLGCTVEKILVRGMQTVGVQLESGEILEADEVISTMPLPKLIRAIHFVEGDSTGKSMSHQISQIAAGLKYRAMVCVAVETSRSACSDVLDNTWIYIQNRGLKLGRVQVYNNWFETPGEMILLGMEFFCDEGDADWNLSDEDWAKLALHDGYRAGIFNSESSNVMRNTKVVRVRDAYPSYGGNYSEKNRVLEFVEEIQGLQTAGRGGTHSYWNMDRTMKNAMDCAKNIIAD